MDASVPSVRQKKAQEPGQFKPVCSAAHITGRDAYRIAKRHAKSERGAGAGQDCFSSAARQAMLSGEVRPTGTNYDRFGNVAPTPYLATTAAAAAVVAAGPAEPA